MAPVRWEKVTLVGVGLLGGSLGLALKKKHRAKSVVGYVRRPASVAECERAGAVDVATVDLRVAIQDADLIILCTPIAQMRSLVRQFLPVVKKGAVVTDVGSVKASVVRDLESIVNGASGHFVGSHPMAGAEKTGVMAARADLFDNAVCVVTPTRKSNGSAVKAVEELWRAVGARLLRMSPAAHDKLVSRTSHLPHVVAAQLANFVLGLPQPAEQAKLCANGFRDTTRVASGSPEMWRDIVLANRKNVLGALKGFTEDLRAFQLLLANGDPEGISEFFVRAKQRRDSWSTAMTSPSPE